MRKKEMLNTIRIFVEAARTERESLMQEAQKEQRKCRWQRLFEKANLLKDYIESVSSLETFVKEEAENAKHFVFLHDQQQMRLLEKRCLSTPYLRLYMEEHLTGYSTVLLVEVGHAEPVYYVQIDSVQSVLGKEEKRKEEPK